MHTLDTGKAFRRVFSELVDGTNPKGGYVLNTGDIGLLHSLEKISAADASRAVNGGATIAAHTQHLRSGLSLMNKWAAKGGNPFANAKWDEAWKMSAVTDCAVAGDSGRTARRDDAVAGGVEGAARNEQRRADRPGRQHRASRLSPRRDSADRQGRARTERRNV